MKKLIFFVIALAIIGGLWYAWSRHSSATAPDIQVQTPTSKPDASNATFDFEDGPVTLKSGLSSVPTAPDSAITTDTSLTDDTAYGDVNNDGKNDAAVILLQTSGGSGLFVYTAVYASGNVAYKGSNAVFLGDRISPQSISIDKSGVIKVTYLDRKPNEAMAEDPTVLTTKNFVFKNDQLEEK